MDKKRKAKGLGNLKKNPNGTFTLRKSVGYKEDGKRKVLTITAATETACVKAMKEKEKIWDKAKKTGTVQLKNTVAELCSRHLDYQVRCGQLKNKSIDRRECTIHNQIEPYPIAGMQIHSVKASDIESHISTLIHEGKLSSSSIEKAFDVINAAFQWAVNENIMDSNPAERIKKNVSSKLNILRNKKADEADVIVFSKEEAEVFEKEAMRRYKNGNRCYSAADYLLLLLYTGMRCGELISLRWKDVDWNTETITIEKSASMAKNRDKKEGNENNFIMMEGTTKNHKARTIKLTPQALEVLKRIYGTTKFNNLDDLIAPTETGRMNTTSNLEHRQKVLQRNAGLGEVPGGLHILRKTFATKMYDNGFTIGDIAAYIGDLESTTSKYYISNRGKIKTAHGYKYVVELKERGSNLKEQV